MATKPATLCPTRTGVNPRVYEPSLTQFATFVEEPQYWRGKSKSLLFVQCLIPFWVREWGQPTRF